MLLLAGLPACSQPLTPHERAIAEFEKLGGTFEGGFLDLKGSKVTDIDLAHLKGLNLKGLNLAGTQVTDAGLVHLEEELPGLRGLFLSNTKITDAGLVHFKDSKLQSLFLGGTQVTDMGFDDLEKALPKASIAR